MSHEQRYGMIKNAALIANIRTTSLSVKKNLGRSEGTFSNSAVRNIRIRWFLCCWNASVQPFKNRYATRNSVPYHDTSTANISFRFPFVLTVELMKAFFILLPCNFLALSGHYSNFSRNLKLKKNFEHVAIQNIFYRRCERIHVLWASALICFAQALKTSEYITISFFIALRVVKIRNAVTPHLHICVTQAQKCGLKEGFSTFSP